MAKATWLSSGFFLAVDELGFLRNNFITLNTMGYIYPFKAVDVKTKLAVWQKATAIEGYDEAIWRRDICGHAMNYYQHGNIESEYGWKIDHIKPSAKGGPNTLKNLQPLYWETNRSKGDQWPWNCSMLKSGVCELAV